MKQFLNFNSLIESKQISGWGRKSFVESKFLKLESEQGIKDMKSAARSLSKRANAKKNRHKFIKVLFNCFFGGIY